MKIDELLKFAPKEWLDEYQQAAAALPPVDGCAQDCHGVIHGVIGNFTQCDAAWVKGADNFREYDAVSCGWNVAPKDAAVTCFWCLEGIPHWA